MVVPIYLSRFILHKMYAKFIFFYYMLSIYKWILDLDRVNLKMARYWLTNQSSKYIRSVTPNINGKGAQFILLYLFIISILFIDRHIICCFFCIIQVRRFSQKQDFLHPVLEIHCQQSAHTYKNASLQQKLSKIREKLVKQFQ